ncbi:hypothetical protein BHM03_00002377, partial [Ensete ventricosum]
PLNEPSAILRSSRGVTRLCQVSPIGQLRPLPGAGRTWRAAHRRSAEKDGGGGGRRNAPREEVEHLAPLALPPADVGSAALSLTAPPPTRSVKTLPRRFYLFFLHLFLCVIISLFPTISLIVLIPITLHTIDAVTYYLKDLRKSFCNLGSLESCWHFFLEFKYIWTLLVQLFHNLG